jgi:hypothetical protein
MADTKITALTSISTGTDPANDVLPIVDISDNAITPSGTTKKVTTNQLLGAGGTASFATLAVSGLTTLSDNIVMASAKGIDFTATAGVGTSELLNDYEEGTWVPTDASGAGLTLTSSACRYTKIGRAVTIQGIITYPSTASASTALIAGLPFAYTDAALMSISFTAVAYSSLAWLIGISGYTELYPLNPAGTNVTNATMSLNTIRFFGTYYTA